MLQYIKIQLLQNLVYSIEFDFSFLKCIESGMQENEFFECCK
jgi:hypothetical protein